VLIQFKVVETSEIFVADTLQMMWAQVSGPSSDPNSIVQRNGKLVPQGFGIYALEGNQKPATIGVFVVAMGVTVKIFLRANVEVNEFTMPVPISQVLYEVLPTDPQQVAQAIGSIQEANNANNSGNADSASNLVGTGDVSVAASQGSGEGQEATGTPGTDGEAVGGPEGNA